MSATNRGSERKPYDFYITPEYAIRSAVEGITLPVGRWVEPCAGNGQIIRTVNAMKPGIEWTAIDVREECRSDLEALLPKQQVTIADFLNCTLDGPEFDVAITNPPYGLALEVIGRAMMMARYVVVLTRLNFLGSQKRAAFMQAYPPDVYGLPRRPSFTKGGTDATEYAWLVWPPERSRAHGTFQVLEQ